jgi:hypothetical protein
MFVAEGAKMEASERVTSTAMLALVSNWISYQLSACQEERKARRTREPVMFGRWMILLQVRSVESFG